MSETSVAETIPVSLKENAQKAWQKQIDHLIIHNYHTKLGMSEEEYRKSMPEFSPQPPKFAGRFDKPLLVDPRLDLRTQLSIMRTENDLDNEDPDLVNNIDGVETPDVPYQIWIQIGQKYKGKTVDALLADMPPDERGLTTFEGLAIYREYTEMFTNDRSPGARFSIGLAGSVDNNPTCEGLIPQILYWVDDYGKHGEAEMWTHDRTQANTTGGWPTAGI